MPYPVLVRAPEGKGVHNVNHPCSLGSEGIKVLSIHLTVTSTMIGLPATK